MNSTVEVLGPCQKRVHVTVPKADIKKRIESAYSDLRNSMTIPGFRKGKAPRAILERRFGKEVLDDIKRDVVMNGIEEALKSHEIQAVGDPDVDFGSIHVDPESDTAFTVTFEVKPDFALPIYTGLEVTRREKAITEEMIDKVVESLREQHATIQPVEDRPASASDTVFGTLRIRRDGRQIHEETVSWYKGNTHLPDWFGLTSAADVESKVVGLSTGGTSQWSATLPDDFEPAEHRGAAVDVELILDDIKAVVPAEINEEFLTACRATSLEELRADIRRNFVIRHKVAADRQVADDLMKRITQQSNFDVPQTVIKRTVASRALEKAREKAYQAASQGIEITKDFIDELIKTESAGLETEAVEAIRSWYILEKIAKKEKIFVTESDVELRIQDIAAARGKKTAEIRKQIEDDNAETTIRADILEGKVMTWLIQNARIVDEQGAPYTHPVQLDEGAEHGHDHDGHVHDEHCHHDHDHDAGHDIEDLIEDKEAELDRS